MHKQNTFLVYFIDQMDVHINEKKFPSTFETTFP